MTFPIGLSDCHVLDKNFENMLLPAPFVQPVFISPGNALNAFPRFLKNPPDFATCAWFRAIPLAKPAFIDCGNVMPALERAFTANPISRPIVDEPVPNKKFAPYEPMFRAVEKIPLTITKYLILTLHFYKVMVSEEIATFVSESLHSLHIQNNKAIYSLIYSRMLSFLNKRRP